ncbi:MAG: HEPN domain-containing protein [Planctomycetes bacterium]|nr:HEPN domain-containing protein [Planctomycetota bacterium]
MNRSDFQQLADVRIDEAAVLLAAQKWDGAYYLAGYAVECALKACIAKLTNQHDFPPQRKDWEDCYTHDLEKLVKRAKLELHRKRDAALNIDFQNNWSAVKDWTESSRYERKTKDEAEKLYNAIIDPVHGVLPWLKRYW